MFARVNGLCYNYGAHPLGRGVEVAQRTLDPLTEVRTLPPQLAQITIEVHPRLAI